MSTNYSYLLNFSLIHLQMLGILAVNRLQRKGTMRLLKREAEGGLTIADWEGGFIGISRTGNGWRTVRAGYEHCPCCKGAFDLTIELLGFELMAYNEGDSCQLEDYLLDLQVEDSPVLPYALDEPRQSKNGRQELQLNHT